MRLSLSGRIALVLAAQMCIFGGAVAWLAWSTDSVFGVVSLVKDEFEPVVEDLRSLLVELKTAEDLLNSGRDADIERVRARLPQAHVFERLSAAAGTMRRLSERDDVVAEAAQDLSEAVRILDEVTEGDRLVAGAQRSLVLSDVGGVSNAALFAILLARLDQAASGEGDVGLLARELLRLQRNVRAATLRATNRAASALREMNHHLFERRSEVAVAMMVVPAVALVSALLLLLLLLRALRPVRDISQAIRRLARGDYSPVASESAAREVTDLAEALNALASVLRTREEELRRGRDELVRAERLSVIGRMASVVAHEVRNPLNSIGLNVDLLREMLAGRVGKRESEVLDAVQREIDRLSDITEEYLRFGRLPKGVLAPCDACRVVRETLAFMGGELGGARVEALADVPSQPVMVMADESQLRQALMNLVRNSMEAMPDGGKVTVTLTVLDGQATLSVGDTGCGIPESFRGRLFEPFATTKPGGTGLGLAFVHQVIHECGGRVTIESEPGRGTLVRLFLKMAEASAS